MSSHRETLLCRYQYDALDRLVVSKPSTQSNALRFYLGDHLATEIQGAKYWSLMQHENQLLGQQQHHSDALEIGLLGTDQQRSVLNVAGATQLHPFAYTPYGHLNPQNDLLSLLGFNGQRPDPVTGWYLLGNGYRAFNPVLMRFNSPDSWSPFGEGGLNAYAYCLGDPINLEDRTGHAPWSKVMRAVQELLPRRLRAIGGMTSSTAEDTAPLLSRSNSSASGMNFVDPPTTTSPTNQLSEKKIKGKILSAKRRLNQAKAAHRDKIHTRTFKEKQNASSIDLKVVNAEIKYWSIKIQRSKQILTYWENSLGQLPPRIPTASFEAPPPYSPARATREIRRTESDY